MRSGLLTASLVIALALGGAVPEPADVRLVFLTDLSGSMTTAGGPMGPVSWGKDGSHAAWTAEVRESLATFSAGTASAISIRVGTFANRILMAQEFRRQSEELVTDFERADQTGGRSPVADAIWVALDLLTTSDGTVRDAIVVISDGINTGNVHSLAESLDRAKVAGVPVFTIGTTRSGFYASRPVAVRAANVLRRIADVTGGRYIDCQRPDSSEPCKAEGRNLGHLLSDIAAEVAASQSADGVVDAPQRR